MTARNIIIAVLVLISLTLTGCNAFEALDANLNERDQRALVDEGNLKLAAADYTNALELFDRAISAGGASDESFRGRASSQAGLAGFNMFAVLNKLQNDAIPPDSSAVIFSAAKLIKNPDLLNQAIESMNRLSAPGSDDLLFRSLMVSLSAVKSLLQKYDTNLNQKLDTPDQISFETNDSKTSDWKTLYQQLTANSSSWSLEKAYIELTQSLDGRGTEWITISPIQGISHKGIYTPANRSTIIAVGNFADTLEAADKWFDISQSEFKTLLLALDGVN